MSQLYEKIGEFAPAALLYSTEGIEKITIPCEPGNGKIKRGAIMYRKSSGLWAPATDDDVAVGVSVDVTGTVSVTDVTGTGTGTATDNMYAILDEDVDTGSAPDSGVTVYAEDAAAYRQGRFIDGMVFFNNEDTLTAAHKVILSKQGITFGRHEETGTFDNHVTGI